MSFYDQVSFYDPASCRDEAWAEDRLVRLCVFARHDLTVRECEALVAGFLERQYRRELNGERRASIHRVLRASRWLVAMRLREERSLVERLRAESKERT